MAGEASAAEITRPSTVPPANPQHSPINILPPELLAEIFDHCTRDSFSPVVLSHVSALWRRTAITTPRIWGSISVTLPSPVPDSALAKVRAWLSRSGAFPLHVSLIVNEWSNDWKKEMSAFNLLSDLREHSRHWRRLSVTAGSFRIARGVFLLFALSSPLILSRIDIKAGPFTDDEIFLDDQLEPDENVDSRGDITATFLAIHVLATFAPHFTELNVLSSALPYAVWGTTAHPEFPHLRTLRIFEHAGVNQISARSVLRLLAKCPALEFFSFRGWYFFEPRSHPLEIVDLPHLRELHLAQTFHQRIILSHLSTPSLEILRLSWLNRPDLLIDESYQPDMSEDDADPVEYSQSPYTDILTGVGLRTLIRRCTPPIRVLDMDFVDARSPKDFVWLFAHLPVLTTFRIVGSDMSDNVLSALAFPRPDGTWLCPRLTSLEFSRCDLITGHGVVALAKGRNAPAESDPVEAADKDERDRDARLRPARLTRFSVEACAAVDCESVAVKQYLLDEVVFDVAAMPSCQIYPEEGVQIPD